MAERPLEGRRIAILVADGFEQSEYTEPKRALEEAGALVDTVSIAKDTVTSMKGKQWDAEYDVDVYIDDADVEHYDALVLPGGVMNPDFLRVQDEAVAFVKAFFAAGKPVGAICHGLWMLAEADVLTGRRVTSYHSIKTDLINAGAEWVDREVVVDGQLVSSRRPDDLPAFNAAIIETFAEATAGQERRAAE